MYRVERLSIRAISQRTGLHHRTIRRALAAEAPPRYVRAPAGSKLDPFKDWICEQLREDPAIQAQRLRELAAELGYEGGKTIFDDYVREVRPRFRVGRTFQRTIYRPGELVQCDLWEPREPLPVGYGQTRRAWVVTAEVCWSRVIAGAVIFSKEAPDILWGLGRCLERFGALPEKLVWDREGAIAAGGRPTDEFAAFCGQLEVGWVILDRGDAQAKGLVSYCTSWGRWGWFSFPESPAAALDESRVAGGRRLIEPVVLVVGLVGVEQSGAPPGVDGVGVHAELFGDFLLGEQAAGA
jgi:hypothetical protein